MILKKSFPSKISKISNYKYVRKISLLELVKIVNKSYNTFELVIVRYIFFLSPQDMLQFYTFRNLIKYKEKLTYKNDLLLLIYTLSAHYWKKLKGKVFYNFCFELM